MTDQYHVDLSQYSMTRYVQHLAQAELMPGRRPLKEHLSERFMALQATGIEDLDTLLCALSTAKRRTQLAQQTGIPERYLVLLRREANSMRPNPISLGDFPEVNRALVERFRQQGVKNSRQLLATIRSHSDCALWTEDARQQDEIWALVQMSDLVRINGVGPVFAHMLLDVGISDIKALAQADADLLYEQLVALNNERNYTRAKFTLADMQTCIDFAKTLPVIVESDMD